MSSARPYFCNPERYIKLQNVMLWTEETTNQDRFLNLMFIEAIQRYEVAEFVK